MEYDRHHSSSAEAQIIASSKKDFYVCSRAIAFEQHSQSFRWLTASLLAINGAAAIAILNSVSIPISAKLWSGIFFLLGILLALGIAVCSQRAGAALLPLIQTQVEYWDRVQFDGQRIIASESEAAANAKMPLRWSSAAQVCGWLSALTFCVGFIIAGANLG